MTDEEHGPSGEDGRPSAGGQGWPSWARRLTVLAVGVVLLLVAALLAGVAGVRRSLPDTSGTLEVSGLQRPVTVRRDAYGIPQVYADTPADLFFAQGYVQAQDRFWQMDFQRHTTAGRLSEMLGPAALKTDEVTRVLGWRRVASRELSTLSSDSRDHLESYSDGVNAYLQAHGSTSLSLEYLVLGLGGLDYQPEPWTPVDSLAWFKAMAWDLRGNMQDEITRSRIGVDLSPQRVAELYPAYPYAQNRPIVSGPIGPGGRSAPLGSTGSGAGSGAGIGAGIGGTVGGGGGVGSGGGSDVGSNSWVVAGRLTASGKPLLANDPHLGPTEPGIWYQMGLHCRRVSSACPYDVSGVTFAGVPGVVIGHNDHIAWGFTNLDPDVSDLYLEDVRGHEWEQDGRWRRLTERHETIRVRGQAPRRLTVRETAHGPLLSDVSRELASVGANSRVPAGSPGRGNGYAVALRWTALTPSRTGDAIFAFDRATDWRQFRAAARLFAVPSQNLVYADTAGNIGYQAPGRIPVRRRGDTGDYPRPGWRSGNGWTGRYVPFARLPSVYNPPEGMIVTANQAVTGRGYPYRLGDSWDLGYRSQRIRTLLSAAVQRNPVGVRDMQRIQLDTRNPMARVLLPYLLRARLGTPYERAGQRLLRHWDGSQPADSAAAAYFNAVWRNLLRRMFADDLPATQQPDGSDRWMGVVANLLRRPDSWWWDDHDTPRRETRDGVITGAMRDARDELTQLLARDPAQWEWGRLHRLRLDNQTLGRSGIGMVERLFNRGPWPVGGSQAAPDATSYDASQGYAVTNAPSTRMVTDLGDLDASRWVDLTGASGHAFDPHYTDQTDLWARGESLPWAFSPRRVAASTQDTLQLVPGGQGGP